MSEALAKEVCKRFDDAEKEGDNIKRVYDKVAYFSDPESYFKRHGSKTTGKDEKPEDTEAATDAGELARHLYATSYPTSPDQIKFDVEQEWDETDEDYKELRNYDDVAQWSSHASKNLFKAIEQSNFSSIYQRACNNFVLYGPIPIHPKLKKREGAGHDLIFKHQNIYQRFYIKEGEHGRINECCSARDLTAKEIAEQYGKNNLPQELHDHIDRGDCTPFTVITETAPNPNYKPGSSRKDRKAYRLVDVIQDKKHVLDVQGFNLFPWFCPRYDQVTSGANGTSPFIRVLPSIQEVDTIMYDIRQLANMAGFPTTFISNEESLDHTMMGPKQIIPQDPTDVNKPYSIPVNIQGISVLKDLLFRIYDQMKRVFLLDVFSGMQPQNDKQSVQPVSATEASIAEKRRTQGISGPNNRLKHELFSPMFLYIAEEMMKEGYIKPVPDRIKDRRLKVDYISQMDVMLSEVETSNILMAAQEIHALEMMVNEARSIADTIKVHDAKRRIVQNRHVDPALVNSELEAEDSKASREQADAELMQQQINMQKFKQIDPQKAPEDGSLATQVI